VSPQAPPTTTTESASVSEASLNIRGMLDRIAANVPDATAVVTIDGVEFDFRQLAKAASELSARITEGTRVAVRLGNDAGSVVALHAVWAAGASVVSVSAMTPAPEADRRVDATGADLILTPRRGTDLGVDVEVAPGNVTRRTPADDEAVVMFTSGTTGVPKAASLSFTALQASVSGLALGAGLPQDGRLPKNEARRPQMIAAPISHMGGLLGSLTGWWFGKPLLLIVKFTADTVFELAARIPLGVLRLTPAMVYELAHAPGDRSLPNITSANVGTAAIPEATQRAFEDRYGIPILRNYGQTEFAGAIAFEREADVRAGRRPAGTVGRAAPGVEVRIVDADGNELPPGEVGEICARSASTMSGYLDDNGAVPEKADWIRTGDLGTLDSDGFLVVVGRVRDLIVCGGFNIYPAQVESALNDLDEVVDSAVGEMPDERLGGIPVAVVVLRPGTSLVYADAKERLRNSLAAYEIPRKIVAVEAIPRFDTGKVDRRTVVEIVRNETEEL
jgi:long-chain acyl-CoA synthetase